MQTSVVRHQYFKSIISHGTNTSHSLDSYSFKINFLLFQLEPFISSVLRWDVTSTLHSAMLCQGVVVCLYVQPYLLHISQILLWLRKLSAIFCSLGFYLAQFPVFQNIQSVLHFAQSTFLEAKGDKYTHISFGSWGIFWYLVSHTTLDECWLPFS